MQVRGVSLAQRLDAAKLDRRVLDAANIWAFDIETTPMLGYTYNAWKTNMNAKWIVEPGDILSWSAASYRDPRTTYYMDRRNPDMLDGLWQMIDRASYVVTYNGDRFDLPKVRGYFARAGLEPPRPAKSIDLFRTVRRMGWDFKSLDYACRMMGLDGKLDNGGAGNWWACVIDDDPDAWRRLRAYNRVDVIRTLELYDVLRPHIDGHPHIGFAAEDDARRCPRCGSDDTRDVGVTQAIVIRYRMHRCGNCRGLFRSTRHSRAGNTRAV